MKLYRVMEIMLGVFLGLELWNQFDEITRELARA